jgi:hypothetical protein
MSARAEQTVLPELAGAPRDGSRHTFFDIFHSLIIRWAPVEPTIY